MAHVVFGYIIARIGYILLCNFADMSYSGLSFILLIKCVLLSSLGGIILSFGIAKKLLGVITDIFIGIAMYVVIQYGKYTLSFNVAIGAVSSAILLWGMLRIWFKRVRKKGSIYKIIFGRIYHYLRFIRGYLGLISMIIIIGLPICYKYVSDELYEKIYINTVQESNGTDNNFFRDNISMISYIRSDDSWNNLSINRKRQIAKLIIQNEIIYLGIPEGVYVEFVCDMPKMTWGSYRNESRTIFINLEVLENGSAEDSLNTILHEMRHLYQANLVDIYCRLSTEEKNIAYFSELRKWSESFDSYTTVSGDDYSIEEYMNYYTEAVEIDAREYAANNTNRYYDAIDEWLGQNAKLD
ncbi:MAG: hypothetical protein PUB52_02115 [Lachnospiraceae bacterium]|nr:hypothetical protein [Lachnospiraceae bacterium]